MQKCPTGFPLQERRQFARVERAPSPAALDLDLDFAGRTYKAAATPRKSGASAPRKAEDREGHEFTRAAPARKPGARLQPLRDARLNCHPERSVRIRLMNPHAQSKDPYAPTHT
jgi:hypothetical protein